MLVVYDQGVVSACNFLTIIVLGRTMDASEFGGLGLALISTLLVSNLHRAVFTQPMNILAASHRGPRLRSRLVSLLKAHAGGSVLALALLGMLSTWFFPDPVLLIAAWVYVVCFALQETLRRYWHTAMRPEKALRNDLLELRRAGSTSVLPYPILAHQCCTRVRGDGAHLARCFSVGHIENSPPSLASTTPRGVIAEQWPLGRWLVSTVLAAWGAGQIYPFLIAPLGPGAVASFFACRNLLNVVGIFVQSIGNYLPGRAAVLLETEGRGALGRHMLRTLSWAVVMCAAFLAFVYAFAEGLLHLLYGGIYDSAAPLLRVSPWARPVL